MNIDKLNAIFKANQNPPPFDNSKTQEDFWDNEHISKMMLMAHLNPNWDAASRKPETIEATCNWIITALALKPHHSLLDLGCGPGLYATRFYEQGLNVTGIDYSRRSINYAVEQARLNKQVIDYRYENYLELEEQSAFDVITLIYCDFGVLAPDDRNQLLKRIHRALKPGGHFVFDVWSSAFEELTSSYKNWVIHEKQGFWKPTPHLELIHKSYDPSQGVSLKQHIIIEEETELSVYNLWEQCYTAESIKSLLNENGFEIGTVVADLTGVAYSADSKSIGIIARKK